MASLTPALPRPLQRTTIVIGAIVSAVVGMCPLASGQDQSGAIAKDAIFARKILMDTIGRNMDELETMTASQNGVDLAEGHEHARVLYFQDGAPESG